MQKVLVPKPASAARVLKMKSSLAESHLRRSEVYCLEHIKLPNTEHSNMHLPIPPVRLVRQKLHKVLSKSSAFPHKPFQISKLNQEEHYPMVGLRDKERASQ